MNPDLKILFVFVDGIGIGSSDPAINPLRDARFPNLGKWLAGNFQPLEGFFQPLDAGLGVEGLPQSATGQATLLCGVNAAQAMGRHIEGFPPPRLKALVQRENIFSKLRKLGKSCTFANAYWLDDIAHLPPRRESVTTVMTLSALGGVRGKDMLLANQAVCHDLTREHLHPRGYDGPLIAPEQAAEHLLGVAEKNDFTLFEYFMTDRAGHRRDLEHVFQTLEKLERFLPEVGKFAARPNRLVILCSDHGNIEDMSVFTHTFNPVPFIALGDGAAEYFQSLESLADVTPAILRLYGS